MASASRRKPKLDPLDEPPYREPTVRDPRDHLPIPARFASGFGQGSMTRMNRMAEGLYISNIYWTYGSPPQGSPRSCVSDPPASGWGRVLVVEDGPGVRQVLCMWTFRSFRITSDSHEWSSMHGIGYIETDAEKAEWLRGHMKRKWAELQRASELAGQPDWELARRAMGMLGIEPPTEAEVLAMGPLSVGRKPPKAAEKPKGGGEAKPVAAFKPVKATGRKGEVLRAIIDGVTSADALTGQFGITRSNLLSQLFLLRKDHGIGYTVSGDAIALQLPEGVTDPFAS